MIDREETERRLKVCDSLRLEIKTEIIDLVNREELNFTEPCFNDAIIPINLVNIGESLNGIQSTYAFQSDENDLIMLRALIVSLQNQLQAIGLDDFTSRLDKFPEGF